MIEKFVFWGNLPIKNNPNSTLLSLLEQLPLQYLQGIWQKIHQSANQLNMEVCLLRLMRGIRVTSLSQLFQVCGKKSCHVVGILNDGFSISSYPTSSLYWPKNMLFYWILGAAIVPIPSTQLPKYSPVSQPNENGSLPHRDGANNSHIPEPISPGMWWK